MTMRKRKRMVTGLERGFDRVGQNYQVELA
jgi:hypothetical protein